MAMDAHLLTEKGSETERSISGFRAVPGNRIDAEPDHRERGDGVELGERRDEQPTPQASTPGLN